MSPDPDTASPEDFANHPDRVEGLFFLDYSTLDGPDQMPAGDDD